MGSRLHFNSVKKKITFRSNNQARIRADLLFCNPILRRKVATWHVAPRAVRVGRSVHFALLSIHGFLGGQLGVSAPNCLAYSPTSRCHAPIFIASPPTRRPMGVPLSSRSRTSKAICQPAAPHEMKRRSMLDHNVSRVPPPNGSSSQRLSPYSSTFGGSTRVTFVSIGVGVPIQVSFTVPTEPRLPSTSKGAHSRRCAGSVSACQTFSGG